MIQKAITGLATKTSGGTLDNMQVTSSDSDVPAELYSMIHWVMVGPVSKLQTEKRSRIVDRSALSVPKHDVWVQINMTGEIQAKGFFHGNSGSILQRKCSG